MAKTFLGNMTMGGFKKIVYKFVDGKLTDKFSDLAKAATDAGVTSSYLGNYMNKKKRKPRKIPDNVEYSYSNKLTQD